jgi:hypothetical protein
MELRPGSTERPVPRAREHDSELLRLVLEPAEQVPEETVHRAHVLLERLGGSSAAARQARRIVHDLDPDTRWRLDTQVEVVDVGDHERLLAVGHKTFGLQPIWQVSRPVTVVQLPLERAAQPGEVGQLVSDLAVRAGLVEVGPDDGAPTVRVDRDLADCVFGPLDPDVGRRAATLAQLLVEEPPSESDVHAPTLSLPTMSPVPIASFALDVAAVLVFAAVGRHSHAESDAITGVLVTAWPFLTGLAVGWIGFLAAHRRAPRTVFESVAVWVPTVAVGMLLRHLTGRGTPLSFVIVATVVLGIFLLGWRAVAALVVRRQARRTA